MEVRSNQTVLDILGGKLILNIPFISRLSTPTSFLTWIIAILAIMPFVVWIVCIAVILINAAKWVKSNGNEKEIESAKTGIKRAIVGFASMFLLFILANLMSNFFIGTNFDSLVTALAPCTSVPFRTPNYSSSLNTYVYEYARENKVSIESAFKVCGH